MEQLGVATAAGEPDAGDYVPVWNGHGDAVNVSRLADGTLTLANSYRYETWGRPTTATHNAIGDLGFRFTYVGEFDVQWDDQLGLGLLYMHARHYSPALGRFLQPDPDRSDANLYAYAANNPKSRRGINTDLSSQNACRTCNLRKRTMTTTEYLRVMLRNRLAAHLRHRMDR